MKAPAPQSKPRELIKSGTHIARCYQVVDLGTQKVVWEGDEKEQRKIWISFELPKLTRVFKEGEEPKPVVISKKFTFSMGDQSRLKPFIEGMLGVSFTKEEARGFDTNNLLGLPCMLSITTKKKQDGNEFNEILSASPLIEGLECPPQINPNFVFEMDHFNEEMFEKLPNFIKEIIKESKEYKTRLTPEDKEQLAAIKKRAGMTTEQADKELEDITNSPAF